MKKQRRVNKEQIGGLKAKRRKIIFFYKNSDKLVMRDFKTIDLEMFFLINYLPNSFQKYFKQQLKKETNQNESRKVYKFYSSENLERSLLGSITCRIALD